MEVTTFYPEDNCNAHILVFDLTPDRMDYLAERYGIQPGSSDPWVKGVTGGSDDHADLFIGQTFITAPWGATKADFINNIRKKRTFSSGRSNDYKTLAFSIYKIFCDYSGTRCLNDPHSSRELVGSLLFSNSDRRVKNWIIRKKIKRGKTASERIFFRFFEDVLSRSRTPVPGTVRSWNLFS